MITFSAFADEIGEDLKVQMDTCEASGIKCIDVRAIDGVNVSSMRVDQVREYKKQMADRGFTVPCIGSPIGKIRISDDFDAHLDLLKYCCDVAMTFGTDLIRMFSFYPTEGKDITEQRGQVMDRMGAMLKVAEEADAVLMHENESNIYGAKADGVNDLFATFKSDYFKCIFDPANFVNEGQRPYDDCWTKGLAELTEYFHIKDKVRGAETCVPAGDGEGQFAEIFADLKARDWSGYMTLEPHLAAAGQFAGFTGPNLFAKAVAALRGLCDGAGLAYK